MGSEMSRAEGAEAEAARRVADARWPEGVRCPRCDSASVAERSRPGRRWPQWRCRDCRMEFTAVTGTALHGTRRTPSSVERRNPSGPSIQVVLQQSRLSDSRAADRSGEDPPTRLSAASNSVINALRQRPDGASIAKVAEIAGISGRHARRVLQGLASLGLVLRYDGWVRDGHRSRRKRLWQLSYSPECVQMLKHIPRFRAAAPEPAVSGAVPPQFWPQFWSGAEGGELDLARDELHIAGTLIGGLDLSAEAWALRHVSAATLEKLVETRGYDTGDVGKLIRSELRRRQRAAA